MRVYKKSRFNFKYCQKFQNKKGEILWDLHDVCKELNIPRHQHLNAYERLSPDERSYFEKTTPEGERLVLFLVKKSGIYSLILQQKGDRAAEFKRWLAHDILSKMDGADTPIIF